jgi:DNA-cytosine methyltransferase
MKITVASDCSGIETPLMALDRLNVQYEHIFSSDIDKGCKEFIMNNYKPNVFFDNIKDRDNTKLLKDIDLYVAGFPCQAFSTLGRKKGFDNVKCGDIFFDVLDYIQDNLPKIFILENVKGLLTHAKGDTFAIVLKELNSIGKYNVYHQILATNDFNIPQSRNRVYIVGIRKDVQTATFTYPKALPLQAKLADFFDHNATRKPLTGIMIPNLAYMIEKYKLTDISDRIFSVGFGNETWARLLKDVRLCPTIATATKFYYTPVNGLMLANEALALQGIDHKMYNWGGVSESKKYKFAGNCMTVDVLVHLFRSVFNATSLSAGGAT